MSLKYRNKETGQVVIVTHVQWATPKEKVRDDDLMPSRTIGLENVLIHYGYEGQLIPNYIKVRSDFFRTHERVEEKPRSPKAGPVVGEGKVVLCSDCPLWNVVREQLNRIQ